MTISTTNSSETFLGNGATTVFSFNFVGAAASDLQVIYTDNSTPPNISILNPSVYTLVLNAPATGQLWGVGGSVTYPTGMSPVPIPVGTSLTVNRIVPYEQTVSIGNQSAFYPQAVEQGLDLLELQIQQINDNTGAAAVAEAVAAAASATASAATATTEAGIATTQAGIATTEAGIATAAAVSIVPTGPNYPTWKNIFNKIYTIAGPTLGATIIAEIQANTLGHRLDAYFISAIAEGGSWYLPPGSYQMTNTMTMAPGVEFHGAGMGNTIFYTGGSANQWGIEMLNANGTNEVEAFKLYDITFAVGGANYGIRWNSSTGGFDDTSGTQAYMMRAHIERCQIISSQTYPNTFIGIQMNKCFDSVTEDCFIEEFGTGIHYKGTDISRIQHNRIKLNSVVSINIESAGTFGSTNKIIHNDILSPGDSGSGTASALITSDRDGYFCENYIEGSATVTNAIQVVGGFNHKINDNRIEWAAATNVIQFTTGFNNPYGVEFCNNHTTGAMGEIIWQAGTAPYFNNSTNRNFIRVSDNTVRSSQVPFLSEETDAAPTTNYAVYWTAGRGGVSFAGLNGSVTCSSGDFLISANSDVSKYIQFGDYSSLSFPGNALPGTFTITLACYSGTAGQILSWRTLDDTTSIATGTITCTNANQIYFTTIASSHAFTVRPVVRVWNADTGHGGTASVRSIGVTYG